MGMCDVVCNIAKNISALPILLAFVYHKSTPYVRSIMLCESKKETGDALPLEL